ncbi:MAG: diaminopimelate decarboxylase [Fimbriimonadaceae bacterium]|nr:diaminopimelate decarboxylase [Fimbriimonadaceae bacterium]
MSAATMRPERFRLGASDARELAERFGTPLYVMDADTIRDRACRYRSAAAAASRRYDVSYASKANSLLGVLALVRAAGLSVDVASEGEFRAAEHAGFLPTQCHFHGNFKSESELDYAVSRGIGTIVIDHFSEIEQLRTREYRGEVVIRVAPGVQPDTNPKISTGQRDTKFGFGIGQGAAREAVRTALRSGLDLKGFHIHVGSQILNLEAHREGARTLAQFAAECRDTLGYKARYLNLGGGLGIRYLPGDRWLDPCDVLPQLVAEMEAHYPMDELTIGYEPGRWIVGEAGVTLYRIGVVKDVGVRTYVAVDGGVSDNPRPAMYGSAYDVEVVPADDRATWDYVTDGPGAAFGTPRARVVTVAGKHCETDTLFPDVEVRQDVVEGDLLQVMCTGAYHHGLSSQYNRFRRPATVLRDGNTYRLIQRRDDWADLFSRESV